MADGWRIACDIRSELGEGPLWSARENAVYWVDILGHELHRLSLADSSVCSWKMPAKIGWVIERRDAPGFIAGLQTGFHALTLEPFECRLLVDPEPELPDNRMNDAKADSRGRIWAGTMDCEIRSPTGSLYRLDHDLGFRKMDTGYLVTNGPAFGDGCLYHSDTGLGIVYRFTMTPDGDIGDRREFIRFPREWGYPDGMTVDAEGFLWIAHWGGGRVSRFTPDGQLDRAIALPASQITSCTFAGVDLDRLFVTSAAENHRDDEPLAGMLFEVDPGVRGLPPNLFGSA